MKTQLDTPTHERWLEILSQQKHFEVPEYRRQHPRHDIERGAVALVFEELGVSVVRTGIVLNASAVGLMIKQHKAIRTGTRVRVEAMLGDNPFLLTGRVVHSTPTTAGFKVGIELEFPGQG
jgi:hypothetical protein